MAVQTDYYVVSMDFQTFGNEKFKNEYIFSKAFASSFFRLLRRNDLKMDKSFETAISRLDENIKDIKEEFTLMELFEGLSDVCGASDKGSVLIIDEVDSAANNQVFIDFLAQLRAYYIARDIQPTFQSVILAGVYDVKNLKRKLRPEDVHGVNSPWNIAADFKVDMSFSKADIAGMLCEYEYDNHTGMDIEMISGLLYDYTSGYPFLVSRICKLLDEEVGIRDSIYTKQTTWTLNGFNEAVRMLLSERNMLFESLSEKLTSYPELNTMLCSLLFTGKNIVYNYYEPAINIATMFGFVKNQNGTLAVANRIFDTWLYNLYLSTADMQGQDIYKASLQDRSQFIIDGHLDMKRILEKFVVHFNDIYGDSNEKFMEDEGRKYFLLYLKPIINETGNYYIESRTRELRRTDVIVDYRGEQYVIELKILHGEEYNNRGERQLLGYLDDYHTNKGYMVSFNFNKRKKIGVHQIVLNNKVLIEAVV